MSKIPLNTNVASRVKKIKTQNFLMALFEAISNSIDSTELTDTDRTIAINILRNPKQTEINKGDILPITGFKITDNGIGFNKTNMDSFAEIDTEYKASKGAKGVGRLTWLKFFEKVKCESVFIENGTTYKRTFSFTTKDLDGAAPIEIKSTPTTTTIELISLLPKYEHLTRRTLAELAESIINHFIAFLATDALPTIDVYDNGSHININSHYSKNIGSTSKKIPFIIGMLEFTVTSMKYYIGTTKHIAHLCGNKRVAEKVALSSVDRFFSDPLTDHNLNQYAYYCFVESPYLDSVVNDDRDGFQFPSSKDYEISLPTHDNTSKAEIIKKVLELAHTELASEIEEKKNINKKNVEKFVINEAPQYRKLIKQNAEQISNIHDTDPIKIDAELRKIQLSQEIKTKNEVAELIKSLDEEKHQAKADQIKKKSQEILTRLNDESKASLANHIVKRNLVLQLLKKHLEIEDNTFSKEEMIHELIFPMRTTSDDVDFENQNLWIIDEKLTYHHYLASDKPLSAIPDEDIESQKEPDIIIFDRPIAINDRPDHEHAESIVILEFKRPGISAATGKKNPVEQIQEYIELIISGKAKTKKERLIQLSPSTYFYGYVICELDEPLKKALQRQSMKLTPDGRGMYGYFDSHRAYIEVISYDKMLDSSIKRNKYLFEKLQLPVIT